MPLQAALHALMSKLARLVSVVRHFRMLVGTLQRSSVTVSHCSSVGRSMVSMATYQGTHFILFLAHQADHPSLCIGRAGPLPGQCGLLDALCSRHTLLYTHVYIHIYLFYIHTYIYIYMRAADNVQEYTVTLFDHARGSTSLLHSLYAALPLTAPVRPLVL
jgi:hypothetical protein